MKKICLAAALLLTGTVFAQQPEAPQPLYRNVGSVLPPIRLVDTTLKVYTGDDFDSKNHLFLFMFNPTCGHCIEMAKLMGKNIKVFKKSTVVFMAGAAMMPYMSSFYKATDIGNYPQIKVGIDSAGVVDKLYGYQTLPQINIYDKHRKLVKIFSGDTPLEALKKYAP